MAGRDQLRPLAAWRRSRPGAGLGPWSWAGVGLWSAVLTAVLLRPLARSGYGLGHDMVFTPQQPLDAASLGVSTAAPRAAPLDALVALAEHLVGGAVVFRAALVLPLVAAAVGAALAVRPRRLAGAVVTASFAIWNPYVVERLAIGQWALLWAYAALPWLVVAARQEWRRRLPLTVAAVALGSITPTGGVIAGGLAVALTLARPPGDGRRSRWRSVAALASVAVLQLPWLLPSLLSTATATSDPAAVDAFASRSDGPAGVFAALLAGGGIWDADVVPASRTGWLAAVALLVVLLVVLAGSAGLVLRLGRRVVAAMGGVSALGVLLAGAASVPGGARLLRWAVADVPGAGLLRDGQKWAMPLVLLVALLAGVSTERALDRLAAGRTGPWRLPVAVGLGVLPLLLLPDAAATMAPTLDPVHYPADWSAVRRLATGGGDAVVVPFAAYRTFSWAPGRPVLDPAARLLAVPVVVDDRLAVSGRLLAGEDRHAMAVGGVLAGPGGAELAAGLRAQGVRWVVVEAGTPGARPDLSGLAVVRAGRDVSLLRVPGAVARTGVSHWRFVLVLAADLLALAVTLAGAVGLARWATSVRRFRRREPHRATSGAP